MPRIAALPFLRHPVARAHSSFCALLTSRGPQRSRVLRHLLDVQYDLHLPEKIAGFDPNLHRHAFEKFIAFLTDNLRGQTTLRIGPARRLFCAATLHSAQQI